MTDSHVTHSAEETMRLAASMGSELKGGECIVLRGELGAGKTCFVTGLVRGLGGDPRQVHSPTFVLLNIYLTPRLAVYHLDAYRVRGAEDFEAIGFGELLDQSGIVIVEWGERVAELLPNARIEIDIEVERENARRVQFRRIGSEA